MALAPWNVLASGKFRTDEEEQRRRETGEKGREMLTGGWERTENEKKVSHALEKVAKEVGASHITAYAENAVRHSPHWRAQSRATLWEPRGT